MTIILSSDSHVIEPLDLFDRMDPAFRERGPRLKEDEDGNHWWFLGDHRLPSVSSGSETGKRFEDPSSLRLAARFEDVRPGGYRPDKQLEDNEQDGVWGSVLYPSLGLQLLFIEDQALLADICRAYNDWLAEFCAYRRRPAQRSGPAQHGRHQRQHPGADPASQCWSGRSRRTRGGSRGIVAMEIRSSHPSGQRRRTSMSPSACTSAVIGRGEKGFGATSDRRPWPRPITGSDWRCVT